MTTQQVDIPEISEAELEREYELYAELLDFWPDHWFVITRGELFHSVEPNAVLEALRDREIGVGEVFVSKAPGRPPYRVR